MAYTFTIPQQKQITKLHDDGPSMGQPGNFGPMYIYIRDVLVTPQGGTRPDDDPVVLPVRFWFEGAVQTNSGEGIYSALIREYTYTQGELLLGRRFSNNEMQESSNAIARQVFDTLSIDNSWVLQDLSADCG